MNTKYVVPAVTKHQGQKAALQDCAATIPHKKDALEACSAFASRIPHLELVH